MKETLSKIINILKNKNIKHGIHENIIYIPYIIEDYNKKVNIIIKKTGNVVILTTMIDLNRDIEWCNQFNSENIIPRAIFNKENNKVILDCIYDLNIFPDTYLEKWINISLYICLNTIKEELENI